jgi:hypothetical protein
MLDTSSTFAMNSTTDKANLSHLTLEEFEYQQFLEDDLVVVAYLILLSVIGTIGNGHALTVYLLRYKPSNHRTFLNTR